MSVRYRYVRDSRMYRLVPRLEVEGGWFYESNERGKEIEIDDSFFSPPDTGSFSIACTVNDHFAPSFRVIQRGVEIVERSSFPLPPPRSSWIFVYRDDWFPFLPSLLVFSLEFLEASWENVGILLFLDSYLRSYRIRSNREESNRDEDDTQWYGFFFFLNLFIKLFE